MEALLSTSFRQDLDEWAKAGFWILSGCHSMTECMKRSDKWYDIRKRVIENISIEDIKIYVPNFSWIIYGSITILRTIHAFKRARTKYHKRFPSWDLTADAPDEFKITFVNWILIIYSWQRITVVDFMYIILSYTLGCKITIWHFCSRDCMQELLRSCSTQANFVFRLWRKKIRLGPTHFFVQDHIF